MFKKYRYTFLFIGTFLLIKSASFFPHFIEAIYSTGMYPKYAAFLRSLFGNTSIAVGDVMYLILIILLLVRLFITIRNKTLNFQVVFKYATIFLIVFNLSWALNYYRVPLHEKMDFKTAYQEEDLKKYTALLIQRATKLYIKYKGIEDTTAIAIPYSKQQIIADANLGYQALHKKHPQFHFEIPSFKYSLISTPLTYMGFAGYFNPFTNEAQINSKIPVLSFMTTVPHEMAHQTGIGSESEANFIGYLAAINHPKPYYDYAATLFALKYCINRLPFKDEQTYEAYLKKLPPGIQANFRESKQFWEAHHTFIDTIFEFVYDKFLKINNQEFGIEGYSNFIELLINYDYIPTKNEAVQKGQPLIFLVIFTRTLPQAGCSNIQFSG